MRLRIGFALAVVVACGDEGASTPDAFVPVDAANETETVNDASDAGVCGRDGGCVTEVTSGGNVACALRNDSVYCWGSLQYGALGVKPADADSYDFASGEYYRVTPTLVGGVPKNVLQIVAGNEFVCVLTALNQVWCWGRNGRGTLGHDPLVDETCAIVDGGSSAACSTQPTAVVGLDNLVVVEIAAGGDLACARIDTGDIYCWGSNDKGSAGQAVANANVIAATRIAPSNLDGRARGLAIAQGRPVACALRDDESIWCWGDDRAGRTGQPTQSPGPNYSSTPQPVRESDGGIVTSAKNIAVGGASVCAQTASNVRCWGGNDFGGLANATWDLNDHVTPNIAQVASGSKSLLGAGEAYFVRDTFGRVLGWGRNAEGQLGLGDYDGGSSLLEYCGDNVYSEQRPGSCFARATLLPTVSSFVLLAPGDGFVTAIDRDGAVWSWGRGSLGQLGRAVPYDSSCDPYTWPPVSCSATPTIVAGL